MRYVYLMHRWLGLTLGPLVALWFLSGIIMLFVSYPSLSPQARWAQLQPLSRAQVQYTPAQAWQAVHPSHASMQPTSTTLAMQQGRPVYYFLTDDYWQAVWADTAEPVQVNQASAVRQALAFHPAAGASRVALIALDQWSFSGKLNAHRPLFKVALDNEAHTELYVSSRTGEVVLQSSQRERFWNWLGSVTHWIYFTDLRANRALWRQVILWPAAAGILLSVIGLWIGLTRMRVSTRYSRNRHSPYRGMLKVHHFAGYGFGLIVLTWLFSGWLSMTPMNWLSDRTLSPEELTHWQGTPVALTDYRLPAQWPAETKRLTWRRFAGEAVLVSEHPTASQRLDLHTGNVLARYTLSQLRTAASRLQTARLSSIEWLPTQGDAYYRTPNHTTRIARANFASAHAVSYYLDATTGEIAASQDTRSRYYRWLFTALHTWDFPGIEPQFWRKLLIIVLSTAGLAITLTGLTYGIKRYLKQL